MINTILVEDDLYIQKHFAERLTAEDEFALSVYTATPLKRKSTVTTP